MDRDQAKATVKGFIENYLRGKGINTGRPFNCLNPAHPDKHPSMSYDKKLQRVKCFSCNASYDIFDLVGIDYGISDPKEQFKKVYELYGIRSDSPANTLTQEQEEPDRDYTDFYKRCHEDLLRSPEALAYLKGRGISAESIERFNLGYCAEWKHHKTPEGIPTSKRIIIPRSSRTYQTRRIDEPATEKEKQYQKQLTGHQTDMFNTAILEDASEVVVCEGELDAISFYQAGAPVIGLGAITNIRKFSELAKKYPDIVYLLALDNDPQADGKDSPGIKAQKDLVNLLKDAGLVCFSANPSSVYGNSKDANAALVADPVGFGLRVSALLAKGKEKHAEAAEKAKTEAYKKTGAGMLDDFLLRAKTAEYAPISTGIQDIDNALGGGFMRKTLVMLGAAPGMGKTTLAQWIFENMAEHGEDVIYYNLEMDRGQLLARSLSRIIWKYWRKDITPLDIMRGYGWTEEQEKYIDYASDRYKEETAAHLIYNPINDDRRISVILESAKEAAESAKKEGKQAPLICIDYLQYIDTGDFKDPAQGLKNAIADIKRFAIDYNTVVFLIMANNRNSNKSGISDTESGRDTSAIEYTADVLLGLSYTALEDRLTYPSTNPSNKTAIDKIYTLDDIRKLKRDAYEAGEKIPAICNRISLKVNKNRFGASEKRTRLIMDGAHNTFMIEETNEIPTSKPVEDFSATKKADNIPFEKKRFKERETLKNAFEEAVKLNEVVTVELLAELMDVKKSRVVNLIKEYEDLGLQLKQKDRIIKSAQPSEPIVITLEKDEE